VTPDGGMARTRTFGGEARRTIARSTARRREPQYLYLTTTGRRTGRPREIEIWFTRRGVKYYLIAETGERAQWVGNIRADARVSWRVGRRRVAGRARVVDPRGAPALRAAVRRRSEAKYGWGDGLVVELTPAPHPR
jgi:deazaflavin-dependent oxidoreductase (nitroreductase family)